MAVETTRAAQIALHAAVGVAWGVDPRVARMLRAAEMLCRSSVALLSKPPPPVVAAAAAGDADVEMTSQKLTKNQRKRRNRNKKKAEKAKQLTKLEEVVAPGGSVLVGDLRELGVSSSTLVLPPTSPPAASGPVAGLPAQLVPAFRAVAPASGRDEVMASFEELARGTEFVQEARALAEQHLSLKGKHRGKSGRA